MPADLELTPDEVVPGRPFTDPAQTRVDEEALRRLLDGERYRVSGLDGAQRDVLLQETDAEGCRHLLVVPDVRALLETQNPTVVGFFGRPRADADAPTLFSLEEELVSGMAAYAAGGLLSYYDVELAKDDYGNLIFFAGPEGPEHWRTNPVHARAVEISPANYEHIRLHRGALAGRLLDGGDLHVTSSRYLDYRGGELWRAVRTIVR